MPRGLLGSMLPFLGGGTAEKEPVKIEKRGFRMNAPGPGHGLVDVECRVTCVLSDGRGILKFQLKT